MTTDDDTRTLVRTTDPDTSQEAAESISPRLRELQAKVLAFACERWNLLGFTDPEMNDHFGTTSSTFRTRRAELVDKGYISDTGRREPNRNGSGRRHIVWAATKEGCEANAGIEPPKPTDADGPEVFETHNAWVQQQERMQ